MLRCDVVASVQLLREEMDSLKFVEYGPCLSTLPTTDPPSALIPGLDEPDSRGLCKGSQLRFDGGDSD